MIFGFASNVLQTPVQRFVFASNPILSTIESPSIFIPKLSSPQIYHNFHAHGSCPVSIAVQGDECQVEIGQGAAYFIFFSIQSYDVPIFIFCDHRE